MDVDSIINKAAAEPKTKKKSDVPTLVTNDKKIAKAISDWRQAKTQENEAKTKYKLIAEQVLIPAAREFHKTKLAGLAKVPTTVKIESGDNQVQVDVAKKQYSVVPMDDQPELVSAFGKKTEEFFERKISISLTNTAIKDKNILAKLIKAVGQENFQEYFKVEHSLVPTEAFHNARFLDAKIAVKADKLIAEEVIKPYSPAIR